MASCLLGLLRSRRSLPTMLTVAVGLLALVSSTQGRESPRAVVLRTDDDQGTFPGPFAVVRKQAHDAASLLELQNNQARSLRRVRNEPEAQVTQPVRSTHVGDGDRWKHCKSGFECPRHIAGLRCCPGGEFCCKYTCGVINGTVPTCKDDFGDKPPVPSALDSMMPEAVAAILRKITEDEAKEEVDVATEKQLVGKHERDEAVAEKTLEKAQTRVEKEIVAQEKAVEKLANLTFVSPYGKADNSTNEEFLCLPGYRCPTDMVAPVCCKGGTHCCNYGCINDATPLQCVLSPIEEAEWRSNNRLTEERTKRAAKIAKEKLKQMADRDQRLKKLRAEEAERKQKEQEDDEKKLADMEAKEEESKRVQHKALEEAGEQFTKKQTRQIQHAKATHNSLPPLPPKPAGKAPAGKSSAIV